MKTVKISEQFCVPSSLDLPSAFDVFVTVNYEANLVTISSTKFDNLEPIPPVSISGDFNAEAIDVFHNAFLGIRQGFQMLEEHYKNGSGKIKEKE